MVELVDPTGDMGTCPGCGRGHPLRLTDPLRRANAIPHCVVCDCPKVYTQKDFNRTLGVGIFVAGAVVSLVLYGFDLIWQAMAVLLGCAVVDAVLYKLLPEVTICYKCHAQYRQVNPHPANAPFELGLAEKFDPLDKRAGAENPAAHWQER